MAHVRGRLATDLVEISHDLADLDRAGFWVVVGTFEGEWTLLRFRTVREVADVPGGTWAGPDPLDWSSSMDRHTYLGAVRAIKERIARGDVYQVNLCRVLTASGVDGDLLGLRARVAAGNPAPYLWTVLAPDAGIEIVSASPERFLRRDGNALRSSPIKGTGVQPDDLAPKDVAENVMIVDLVRNDLSRVADVGSVAVDDLLRVEQHPGLVHLVSTVSARLRPGTPWSDVICAAFPPGSVSGAPKHTALQAIRDLEPCPRGPYCGALGWVEGDQGELAVGIRTFWRVGGSLSFGTGAGITWGSTPEHEWEETRLKARNLLRLAASSR